MCWHLTCITWDNVFFECTVSSVFTVEIDFFRAFGETCGHKHKDVTSFIKLTNV